MTAYLAEALSSKSEQRDSQKSTTSSHVSVQTSTTC